MTTIILKTSFGTSVEIYSNCESFKSINLDNRIPLNLKIKTKAFNLMVRRVISLLKKMPFYAVKKGRKIGIFKTW